MQNNETLHIEVVYALPDAQYRIELQLPAGSTASAALERSGLLQRFPEIDLGNDRMGIFGRTVKPDYVLADGQRLEIYRPLLRDPKEARRERAAQGRHSGKARR